MILLFKLLILLTVLLLIVIPYFTGQQEDGNALVVQSYKQRELLRQKESAYTAIKELDFDYRMGKLSAEDHKALRAKYEQQAISFLKQLDALGIPSVENKNT